jgi:alpha-amylase/alpha-mannosidase (GH57 family)
MPDKPALIIHGHFYQPPRENPWTGIVDREPSAAPFHDWNARIHRECYRPNGWARVFDSAGRVADIVNNYERISFNFGPTLLSWLERHHPRSYRRILDADRDSARERGWGNAIAQGYNHAILPLCNDRDLRTQIRWGIEEFRFRYHREPDSLWMPETACDERTLAALIDAGMKYALLAPQQAAAVKIGGAWHDVSDGSIDPRKPYRYVHPDGSGREIALFFYDGSISRAVAFEGALSSSRALLDRFELATGGSGSLVHAVTDGESYGHHFKYGDRCLAHALGREAEQRGFWVTNYAAYLERHPAELEVRVKKGEEGLGSSWSCAHGVGRWIRDCGCHTGGQPGWDQSWRGPLRDALDGLRDRAVRVYEDQMGDLVANPWALRDEYVHVLLERSAERSALLAKHAGRPLDGERERRAFRLLESQRSSMLMYTSCGWFFNELSGLETVQIMRYAGRLVGQLRDLGVEDAEGDLLAQLGEAKSNVVAMGTGADIYRSQVLPAGVGDARIAAHVSMASIPCKLDNEGELAGYRYELRQRRSAQRGRVHVAAQHVHLEHAATGQERDYASCALHFGGVELHCVLREHEGEATYEQALTRIWTALETGSLLTLLRVAEEELGPTDFGVDAILPSARDDVSRAIFDVLRERYAAQYEAMYQDARINVAQFDRAGLPLPRELKSAIEVSLAYSFDEAIEHAPTSGFDRGDYERALAIVAEAERHDCQLRRDEACAHFDAVLGGLMQRVCTGDIDVSRSGGGPIDAALSLLQTANELSLELDLELPVERLIMALRGGLGRSHSLDRLVESLGVSQELLRRSTLAPRA